MVDSSLSLNLCFLPLPVLQIDNPGQVSTYRQIFPDQSVQWPHRGHILHLNFLFSLVGVHLPQIGALLKLTPPILSLAMLSPLALWHLSLPSRQLRVNLVCDVFSSSTCYSVSLSTPYRHHSTRFLYFRAHTCIIGIDLL